MEMDNLIERFLKKIGVKNLKPFEHSYFELLTSEKDVNRVLATIHSDSLLPYESYLDLFDKIEKIKGDPAGFDTRLSFTYDDDSTKAKDLLDSFIASEDAYDLGDFLYDASTRQLIITLDNSQALEDAKPEAKKFGEFLKRIDSRVTLALKERIGESPLKDELEEPEQNKAVKFESTPIFDQDDEPLTEEDESGYSIPDDYADDEPIEPEYSNQELIDFDKSIEEERRKEMEDFLQRDKQRQSDWEKKLKDERTYYPAKLKDIDNLKRVDVIGTIFKVDDKIRTTKKGKPFLNIEYTDGTDSIISTIFESKRITSEFLASLKPGVKIRVKGDVVQDEYKHQLAIKPNTVEILPPDPLREDPSPDKRVELHLHTNMSALDGISSITDYAQLAKSFGMKAIGITDHGVVQAFPEGQKAEKKTGVKMLYGCELYMVDDKLDIVLNPKSVNLNDAEYVVFDLETTGLSARYDRIIEFGATKYCKGQRIDEMDFFINPDRQLREFIKHKTNITQDMVDSGRPIKEALKTILEYFGDAIIIDYNAGFDIGFLNEALKNNGLPQIQNPVIDALPLARYMFPHQRSHDLEAVARTLNIEYDETKVHRANYDAEVLEGVYLGTLSKLQEEKGKDINLLDLMNLTSKDVIMTARPKHIVAFAKNAQGLKDLYKIISLSSTEYLGNVPRTPRELVDENRANLLIGSACFNGEIFDSALTKSADVLKEKMKWYDYIEVQPPACYSWLINDGQISDEEDLKKIIRDLIQAAEEIGKIVVATSDCHYRDPEQKVYRDVYVFSKGLKNARHPLNPFRRDSQPPYPNPDQHFRSTQEMKDEFGFLNDPDLIQRIVVTNTNKIADMIDSLKPTKDKLYPPTMENCEKNLVDLVYKTAKETYGDPLPKPIQERLDTEINGIVGNGYTVIYWIASILVRKVNGTGHLVGSRGSVGSSLVATMSGITEVNPLPPYWLCTKCKHLEWADPNEFQDGFDLPDKECPNCHTKMKKDGHNIPFETFLGFHADKVPDIDLNFPSDFQAQAHEMTRELMGGGDYVFKAGTIQTTEEKNAIGYVKGYFENRKIDPKTVRPAEIDRLAAGCIGVKRTTGQHPGGIIVIPRNMSVFDFTPYQYPANSEDASWKTTHYDFHAIHDNVLKFDELGHVDPYAIKMMCDMAHVDWKSIPFDDPETMSLFWSVKALHLKKNILGQKTGALGLPEFGTRLARSILEETQPRGFGDLVRISGLSHGTNVYAGNAQDLILSGKATLRDVIGCRDDIMVQLHDRYGMPSDKAFTVMEFVRHGYFTKPGFEQKAEETLKAMKEYDVGEDYIESCRKIAYLFPKGHACAYVMMAVRVAWFKVHFPEIYYAVYYTLRCDAYDLKIMQSGQKAALHWLKSYEDRVEHHMHIDNKEKALVNTLNTYVEMTDRGISFGKLSISKSDATMFTVDPETKKIIPPFSAVETLGEVMAKKIAEERDKKPFESVEDFIRRCRISDAIAIKLRELGAFDGVPESEQMTLDEFLN